MFKGYCKHCITEGMCYEQGLCVKDLVDEALGLTDDMLSEPVAELTDKAKIDHMLLMVDVEKNDAGREDSV